MSQTEKLRILIIISKFQFHTINSDFNSILWNKKFCTPYFILDYLIDPTRKELEDTLKEKQYLFVIAGCSQSLKYMDRKQYIFQNYNIIKVLETYNVTYLGTNYNKGLIFSDYAAYLNIADISLKCKIASRYSIQELFQEKQRTQYYFPAYLKPVYFQNIISKISYYAASCEEGYQIISDILSSDKEIDEILIQKRVEYSYNVSVIILGNAPQLLNFIYITDLGGKYISNQNLPIPIKTAIINKSYQLFYQYGIIDYGYFHYFYSEQENKYYLTEIDIRNMLNISVMDALHHQYHLTFNQIFYLYVIVLIGKKNSSVDKTLFRRLLEECPYTLTNQIISFNQKIMINAIYDYKDICQELSRRILSQDESNRAEIVQLFENTLEYLPNVKSPDSLYLGDNKYDYSFLDDYDNIPQRPQNPQIVLQNSLQILNGQMRWHTSSVLYNIDPSIMFNTVVASAITHLYNPSAMASGYCSGYLKMEQQIVSQLSSLIGWDSNLSSGVFTTGGKICLSYGIKSGANRCEHFSGSEKKPVVICSNINHFSIEAVCHQLGLPKTSCIRIGVNAQGTIDFTEFKAKLEYLFSERIPIGCIIFSGGNTTHCAAENIYEGINIINRTITKYNVPYVPYVYYDLVVCWPWLFFKDYNFSINKLGIESTVQKKIKAVTDIISYAYLADGVGIDFHKAGFAPLTNSLFLQKNSDELYSITGTSVKDNFREPYHYTFCNSRGAADIISAWNILQSVGIEGFQAYIANTMTVANIFEKELPHYGFEVIAPENTYGFATIIWTSRPRHNLSFMECINQGNKIIQLNDSYLYQLTEYCKSNAESGYYLRYLPNYIETVSNCRISVIVVFSMTLHLDIEKAFIISKKIGDLKEKFDTIYQEDSCLVQENMPEEVPK